MTNLLSLPLELRFQIYSDTLSPYPDLPPTGHLELSFAPIPNHWEFSFPPSLLFANKQIHTEAKHIFYGKNTWIVTASLQQAQITLPPMAAIPYVRTALLKIYLVAGIADRSLDELITLNRIDEKCYMLCRITTLQALRIECAEDTSLSAYANASNFPHLTHAAISGYLERHPEMRHSMNECLWGFLDSDQAIVSRLLQPLLGLPGTCSLQKGDICVDRRDATRARILELALSNCLDAVMALRLSP